MKSLSLTSEKVIEFDKENVIERVINTTTDLPVFNIELDKKNYIMSLNYKEDIRRQQILIEEYGKGKLIKNHEYYFVSGTYHVELQEGIFIVFESENPTEVKIYRVDA